MSAGASWRGKIVRTATAMSGMFALVYCAGDLFWPLQRDMRRFDPAVLGRMETRMWRSYYEREPVTLFLELAATLRAQYHFPWLRSYVGAYHAASAAFTFKEGKERADYQKALPALLAYFGTVRNTGNVEFDAQRTATLELEWWIVHRQPRAYSSGALGRACAEAVAALYRLSPASPAEYGRLRAEAMDLRDSRAETGEVTEAEWAQIESLLRRSYQSLQETLRK